MTAADLVSAALLLAAALLTLAASLGLLGFGDVLSRLHAGTKPQVLGLLCALAAVGVHERAWGATAGLLPVLVLQLLTVPIAAHMIGRAAYRAGNVDRRLLVLDELGPEVEAAGRPSGDAAPARDQDGRAGSGPLPPDRDDSGQRP